jgi:transcription antitermination factor NusG
MGEEKKWFVFYTKSRWEKKVEGYLRNSGFEPYLPLNKVLRQWSDRKKKVEVPLFNSYIFVLEYEHRIQEVLKVPGISWNIRHNGRPAVLRDSELQTIKRFLESGLLLETTSVADLEPGDAVKVIDGPLRGAVGYYTGPYSEEKFYVIIETIDQVLRVSIDKTLLEKEGD